MASDRSLKVCYDRTLANLEGASGVLLTCTELCRDIPARFWEWLAEIKFLGEQQNILRMILGTKQECFLHNSVQGVTLCPELSEIFARG